MKLYKYTLLKNALLILSNNGIILKNPKEYNDPFDTVIGDYDSYCTKFAEKAYLKMGKNLRLVARKKAISKFKNEFKNKINDIFNRTLVCCFSKRWDSILMWSHYADMHKGVCIEVETDDSIELVDVVYQENIETIDFELIEDAIKKQTFEDNLKLEALKPFYIKYLDWKYEEEVRFICLRNNKHEYVFSEKGKYFLYVPKITRILLGCKIDHDSKEFTKLINICKEKNIEIKYVVMSNTSFALELNDS